MGVVLCRAKTPVREDAYGAPRLASSPLSLQQHYLDLRVYLEDVHLRWHVVVMQMAARPVRDPSAGNCYRSVGLAACARQWPTAGLPPLHMGCHRCSGSWSAAHGLRHKVCGNVLKTFATVLALLCTCFVSCFLFDFAPTPLFWFGVAATAGSIWLYAYPSLSAQRNNSGNDTGGDAREPLVAKR